MPSREEKILQQAEQIITLSEESVSLEDYDELYNEYKKLVNRYKKIIKINDSMNSRVMNENDELEKDKEKIIKVSREKILSNIASHREQQEKYSHDLSGQKKLIEQLTKDLRSFQQLENQSNEKLEKTTLDLKQTQIKVNKLEDANEKLNMKVRALKEFVPPFDTIVEKEVFYSRQNNAKLSLCMLGVDEYSEIKNNLIGFTTIENFILGILKYLQNSLKKTETVGHFKGEVFYILIPYQDEESIKNTLKTIGHRRVINQTNISLSSGFTSLKEDDKVIDFIQRAAKAFNESKNNNIESSIVIY